ncbi:MAG: hypothetical protein AYL32_008340 [Candidatus Bathyarchaeota archaeon B26-2]|nr:MAG: hypothetical protein AYL32_008340 [Candidatus Bathyarchaeota archaeon B26-2]
MKPIDRVYAALYHEEPDKVPDPRDFAGLGSVIKREIIKQGPGFKIWRSPFGSIHLDYVNPSTGVSSGVFQHGWVDPENFVWWFNIAPAVRWPEDLERIEQPTLDYEDLKKAKKQAEEMHKKGYFVILSHHTAFDTGWRFLRGLKQWLTDIVRDPAFARKVVEFGIKPQMEIANAYIEEAHVDAVYVYGDQGTPEGPFISPRAYREIIYPWDRRLAEAYHKRGAFYFIHSHGYIMPLLEDMIRAGFDAVNPISPLCRMNLAEVKEKYGDKITLYTDLSVEMPPEGKIDTSRYTRILYGSDIKEKVEALTYTVRTAAPGGGFIFNRIARGHTEDQRLYMKAWERLRRYPVST